VLPSLVFLLSLIEIDLYNSKKTSETLSTLFNADKKCWGHANNSPVNKKDEEEKEGSEA
jgi:hypothetical protein